MALSLAQFVRSLGWRAIEVIPSPITGGDGNSEFLLGAHRMTRQLTICRLGHRGDGVADTPIGPGLCALHPAGRSWSRSSAVEGHPDRWHLLHIDKPQP